MGAERPTPRGSKPTMSYVSRTDFGSFASLALGSRQLDPPGPPAISRRVPRRRSGFSLRTRETARSRRGPCGAR